MSLVKARLANTGNTLKPSPTQSTGTSATERVSEWVVGDQTCSVDHSR